MPIPSAPLFRDPIYDGAADPTIIWNRQERSWWIVYTSRRANVHCRGVAWCHGTDIGIASSRDGGRSWLYRGVAQGLEFEEGRNTFWAPELLWHEGIYHMYVSYVVGVPHEWSGERHILHLSSHDLWHWRFQSCLSLSSNRVIDACVHQSANGKWRMWYKDEAHGSHTYAADSQDLYHWSVAGPVITDRPHEGPNVFRWRDSYWMVTDHWRGLGVYQSYDGEQWVRQDDILAQPGLRNDDEAAAHHADVLVQDEKAYIFYFTHPGRLGPHEDSYDQILPYDQRRSSLQVAELEWKGGTLLCNRDEPLDLALKDPFAGP